MVHTDNSQQEDTDVFGINLIPFQCLVCLMNKSAFQTVLSFLLNTRETHFLQDLIEQHIFYLGLRRGRD